MDCSKHVYPAQWNITWKIRNELESPVASCHLLKSRHVPTVFTSILPQGTHGEPQSTAQRQLPAPCSLAHCQPHSPRGENGHELKHMKWPKHQEHLFVVTEHWHRLHGEVLGSPSQEISKSIWTWSWATHCRWPCMNRGVGPGPQALFQPQLPCDS